MTATPTPERLDFADADGRVDGALARGFMGYYSGVLFFDGAVTLDGDFLESLVPFGLDDVDLVVINGDLTVAGRIALYDGTPALYVGGITQAETLEAGDAEVDICDGVFTYLIYGWGSNGTLSAGTVDTPWVINFYHEMWVAEVPRGCRVSTPRGGRDDDDADFTPTNIVESFVPEVVNDDWIVFDVFLDRLRAGLPVLRADTRTEPPRV